MLPRNEVVAMLSSATIFVCPSVYEPLGIVNLEAMACELPVVATATGGIPEVVVTARDRLAGADRAGPGRYGHPGRPDRFVADLAAALTDAVSDPRAPNGWGSPAVAGPWSPSRGARSATSTHQVYLDVLRRRLLGSLTRRHRSRVTGARVY
jgi:starch synthase